MAVFTENILVEVYQNIIHFDGFVINIKLYEMRQFL